MYDSIRQFCERALRIPAAPQPPPGDAAQTQIFRAAPNYYKYLLALWALKSAGSLLALVVLGIVPMIAFYKNRSAENDFAMFAVMGLEGIAVVFALIGVVLTLVLVRLDFEKRWYVVTNRSLRVREGVFKIREATVTFANIQNISISQGPLQRALGVADLRVDTAGGGGSASAQGKQEGENMHTTWFRGVNNAGEIRELMQQRLRKLKDSGLGDHDDQPANRPLREDSEILGALRELRAEASALRQAAQS
jgi:uncharacterized membrane protein YdbT with pleckstrin-like domain